MAILSTERGRRRRSWLTSLAREDAPAPPQVEAEPSLIGRGLKVTGRLVCTGRLTIEGTVEGDVQGPAISIRPNGAVKGDLRAHEVAIAGAFQGRIEAMTVDVAPTARIDATIFHHTLEIAHGAVVKGLRPWRPAADMEQRREAW